MNKTTSTGIEELKNVKIGYGKRFKLVRKSNGRIVSWSKDFNPTNVWSFFAPHLSNKSEVKNDLKKDGGQ